MCPCEEPDLQMEELPGGYLVFCTICDWAEAYRNN